MFVVVDVAIHFAYSYKHCHQTKQTPIVFSSISISTLREKLLPPPLVLRNDILIIKKFICMHVLSMFVELRRWGGVVGRDRLIDLNSDGDRRQERSFAHKHGNSGKANVYFRLLALDFIIPRFPSLRREEKKAKPVRFRCWKKTKLLPQFHCSFH